jgi:hypothetical protein
MSGKVRYIFSMRTPLIEINNNYELDEKGSNINFNNNSNLNIEGELDDSNNKIKENSENSSFSAGASDIPDKYKFPPNEESINLNIDCNKVFSEIYAENENKQILLSQKELNQNPILVQDTPNAINMNKSLKFIHQVYMNQKRMNKNSDVYPYNVELHKNNNINNNENHYLNFNIKNKINYAKNYSQSEAFNKQINRFNNVGNLIMSNNINKNFNKNIVNKKSTYNFERNNVHLNINNNN